ncbi:MAG: hypothetical protein GX971_08225 [Firmicutes bacterium]|nr:hypothetical protein [Bacillota bacterium]
MDSMVKTEKHLSPRLWFKAFLTLLLFVPAYTTQPFDRMQTSEVIKLVLSAPWMIKISWLLPLAKLALFVTSQRRG